MITSFDVLSTDDDTLGEFSGPSWGMPSATTFSKTTGLIFYTHSYILYLMLIAKCCFTECYYIECCYAEGHFTEC